MDPCVDENNISQNIYPDSNDNNLILYLPLCLCVHVMNIALIALYISYFSFHKFKALDNEEIRFRTISCPAAIGVNQTHDDTIESMNKRPELKQNVSIHRDSSIDASEANIDTTIERDNINPVDSPDNPIIQVSLNTPQGMYFETAKTLSVIES